MDMKILFHGTVPKNKKHLAGIIVNALRMAKELSPRITETLIRGDAHESTDTDRTTGKLIRNPLHFRHEFKTPELAQAGKHWTIHADHNRVPPKAWYDWYDTRLSPKFQSDGKTLSEDEDYHYSKRKKRKVNFWDLASNNVTIFTESEIANWYRKETGKEFGPKINTNIAFTTVPLYELTPAEEEQIKQAQQESMMETEKAIQEGTLVSTPKGGRSNLDSSQKAGQSSKGK